MGLLHSNGDFKTKSRILYDVLQDNNQEFISANDKDFNGTFNLLVDLATKLAYEFTTSEFGGEGVKVSSDKFEDLDGSKETVAEAFLDDVFGANSKLTRGEYEKSVSSVGKWIFQSKELRARFEKELGL